MRFTRRALSPWRNRLSGRLLAAVSIYSLTIPSLRLSASLYPTAWTSTTRVKPSYLTSNLFPSRRALHAVK